MPVHVNVNGAWKNTKVVSVNVNGSWKDTYEVYVNDNGIWKPMWNYSWETGSWGACSASCGGGTQTRTATCKRSDGYTVPDSYCTKAGITKPTVSQSCNTQSCSTYAWQTGSWGLCSEKCSTGTKTRSVYCQRNDGTKVNDSFCSGTKPSTSTSCKPDCKNEYNSSWGDYLGPTTCGANQKVRSYFVLTNNTSNGEYAYILPSLQEYSDITYVCTSCAYNETAWVENRTTYVNTLGISGTAPGCTNLSNNWTPEFIKRQIEYDFGSVYTHYKHYYLGQTVTFTSEHFPNGNTASSNDASAASETFVCPYPGCCSQKGYTYYADKNA